MQSLSRTDTHDIKMSTQEPSREVLLRTEAQFPQQAQQTNERKTEWTLIDGTARTNFIHQQRPHFPEWKSKTRPNPIDQKAWQLPVLQRGQWFSFQTLAETSDRSPEWTDCTSPKNRNWGPWNPFPTRNQPSHVTSCKIRWRHARSRLYSHIPLTFWL